MSPWKFTYGCHRNLVLGNIAMKMTLEIRLHSSSGPVTISTECIFCLLTFNQCQHECTKKLLMLKTTLNYIFTLKIALSHKILSEFRDRPEQSYVP